MCVQMQKLMQGRSPLWLLHSEIYIIVFYVFINLKSLYAQICKFVDKQYCELMWTNKTHNITATRGSER